MDYDLTRLGSREFEHLTQALCTSVLGPRVSVFGDGPDGGREATVEGRITWGNDDRTGPAWDGYTVVQAKFRTRPADVDSNLRWLRGELGKELSRWTDARYKRSKERKPDNLLIVTNVKLSAASGGGVETANAEFAALINRHSLNLSAWRLWHYDSLCTLLDAYKDVRITYGGFLVTGDVLARIDEWIGGEHRNLRTALTAHAVKEMIAQQYVRLGQAGHPEDEKLALGSVAIDLPASAPRSVLRLGSDADRSLPVVQAAEYALGRGERVVDHGLERGQPRHLLIVGGPGQGKSTLAQMICQAYRVSLLRDAESLSSEAERLRNSLEADFTGMGLKLPDHLRWPFRIILSEYGDSLVENSELSLLRYIANRVSGLSPYKIDSHDLMTWLSRWPWLLVLDGLDEVASPYIRERVTSGISGFLVDAASANADVLVVATTRPQGYAGELGGEDYERLDLTPLDTTEAMEYAGRLAAARFREDDELRNKVLRRLQEAAENPDSQRLMTTPLQITIMSLLLERRQRVPHDRYQLFDAYFDTIYSREINKPTALGRLLEEHRSHVEAIHEQVALALQRQAEILTERDASMPLDQLRVRAMSRLQDEGHSREQAARLATQLVNAATQRLVFLVPDRIDEVTFEVRSLQEYMAARSLTNHEEQEILDQLRSLAASAHWRNTWLFAAGRIFREREKLRGKLITLLAQVDNEGFLQWLARAGAELATDLLADDLALRSPQYRRLLADQAISRLNSFPDTTWRSLGELLKRIADEDPFIRQKLDRQVKVSLAAGGGARAHAILMLDLWRSSNGGLAARARQLRLQYDDLAPELIGLFLLRDDASARDLKTWKSKKTLRLANYIAPSVPRLGGDDGRAINQLIESLYNNQVKFFRGEEMDDAAEIAVVTRSHVPEIRILEDALSRPQVADVFSEIVDQIPSTDWHVAATLREVVRYWYARRHPE